MDAVFLERIKTGDKEITSRGQVGKTTLTVKSLGTVPIEDLLYTVAVNKLSIALQQECAYGFVAEKPSYVV